MRVITILTVALLATSIIPMSLNQNVYALPPIVIDDFSDDGTPSLDAAAPIKVGGANGASASDPQNGASGVIGGFRDSGLFHDGVVNAASSQFVQWFIDQAFKMGIYDSASTGDGQLTLTYNANGAGLAQDWSGDPDNLDKPGICTIDVGIFSIQGASQISVTLKTDGTNGPQETTRTQNVSPGGNQFIITNFLLQNPSLQIDNIKEIQIFVDGTADADVTFDPIVASHCVPIGGSAPDAVALFVANLQMIGATILPVIGASAIALAIVATKRNK